uniref:non-specific serine/threonine protein kinase n=1 Tax=Saccoglossus kowalevskii TaxID=10224 RepID=A0ABM0M9P7_SACKO|nr:PREDICTED: serine/threonine-protein kinase haspin-like [Saccoglossus kowalevskii]
MELELSLLSIHSHSSEEADVEMEECAGVMTPAKKTVKSKQKAELFKEALTPCKPKDKIMSAREKVLLQCEQINTIPFTKCIPAAIRKKCCKIGEGTFGEVFRMEVRRHSLALKIIPIEGDFLVNDEPQKTFEDILPEIVISRELSALRYGVDNMTANYIELKDVSLIKGKYPQDLIKEWDKYDEKKTSENDRPDIFDSSQLFIIFEFNDGGCDLENFEFKNMQQMKSVFQQVTCSLAVAEKQLQFEHRDLHQGNILVAFTDTDNLHYVLDNEMYEIETHGVQVSLIDFTLSRLKKDGCTVFCNLAEDETLFQGQGDYQFEVYRLMKQYNKNDWEKSCLMTNVLWLHYLVDKLVNRDRRKFTRKQDKMIHKEFLSFYNEALKYHSAEEIFLNCKLCQ